MFPFYAPPSPSRSVDFDAPNGGSNGGTGATAEQTVDSLRDHVIKQSEKLGKQASPQRRLRLSKSALTVESVNDLHLVFNISPT